MNINIKFLVVAYIIGMFVDWIFQQDWQAANKSLWLPYVKVTHYPTKKGMPIHSDSEELITPDRRISLIALLTHSYVYAFFTTLFVGGILYGTSVTAAYWIYIAIVFPSLFITHALIDTRIPVKWIMKQKGMKQKGMSQEQIDDVQNWGFMHIGIDHRLHELVLLILAFFVR